MTESEGRFHIATQNEGHLHASLKHYVARPGDRFEVPLDGYQIDIVRGETLIEIQTSSFSSIKRKLTRLVEEHRIRLVHPVVHRKWVVRQDDAGETLSRTKSRNEGALVDVFTELVYLKDLMAHDNLSLTVLLTDEEEVRRHEHGRAWRRKGWVVQERRLLGVADERVFERVDDFITFLPDELPEPFTTHELAALLYVPRFLAQKVAYCLHHMGAIEEVGRHGHARCYVRSRSA